MLIVSKSFPQTGSGGVRTVQIANTKIRNCIRCSLTGDLKNNGQF